MRGKALPMRREDSPSLGGSSGAPGGDFAGAAEHAPLLGGAAAWEHLTDLLAHPAWHVRRRAIAALGQHAQQQPILTLHIAGRLIDALSDPDKHVREASVRALAKLPATLMVPLLVEALHSDSYAARAHAALALGLIGDPAAAAALAASLCGEDGNLRIHASKALAQIGQAAVPHLAQAATVANWRSRLAALWTLGAILHRIEDKALFEQAVSALRRGLADEETEVRRVAARALAQIGDSEGIAALFERLKKQGDSPPQRSHHC